MKRELIEPHKGDKRYVRVTRRPLSPILRQREPSLQCRSANEG